MYRAIAKIKGIAPYSQSRQLFIAKREGESAGELDERVWREKCNYDSETGEVYVPAMAFKQAIDTAGQRLSLKDTEVGGKSLLTKFFLSEVMCENNMPIGVSKDEIGFVRINADSKGQRGGKSRVVRTLPQTLNWGGTVAFTILSEKIKPAIFEQVLRYAGRSVGVGQFRAERGGTNGRFIIEDIQFESIGLEEAA